MVRDPGPEKKMVFVVKSPEKEIRKEKILVPGDVNMEERNSRKDSRSTI
jgi:hypothetical protein